MNINSGEYDEWKLRAPEDERRPKFEWDEEKPEEYCCKCNCGLYRGQEAFYVDRDWYCPDCAEDEFKFEL